MITSIGSRRVIGAAVLGLGSVYAGFQADPVIALTTLAAAAASGAGLMWLAIKHRLFKGQPRPAWQTTTLGGIGAASGIFADNVFQYVGGPAAAWLFLGALLAMLAGAVAALRLSPYGEKTLG